MYFTELVHVLRVQVGRLECVRANSRNLLVRLFYNYGKIAIVDVCKILLNSVVILMSLSSFGQPALLQPYENLYIAISRVEELELEYGQNSYVLAEPLAELANLYSEHGRYEDAYRALDRATLIIRRDRGLYTREQIPFLRQKIENFAASLDWENAREQMEHIYWFYLQKSAIVAPNLIEDLQHLSSMHLRGVNEDFKVHQSYHFRRAITLNWAALAVAEKLHSSSDKRLVPIIYNLLKQYYLQLVAVNQGGSLGYQLREIYPGSNLVRSRSDTRKYFYYMGRRLLNQLATIYSDSDNPNIEALAMVSLYTADWQVMFGLHAEALQSYRSSFKELEEISPNLVKTVFSIPRIIPVSDFYDSMKEVINEDNTQRIDREDALYSLLFLESGAGFPSLGRPTEFAMSEDILSNRALLAFELPGVSLQSVDAQDFEVTSFAKVSDVEILELDNQTVAQVEKFKSRVQDLSFRPKIIEGFPKESKIMLEYKMFSRLKE